MPIIFENVDNGETVAISESINGKWYRAVLAAYVNSSNLGLNHDRGQDFGWRLVDEQQAIIEAWSDDPQMVAKVADYTKVMVDNLGDTDFLNYLLYQQELGQSPEKASRTARQAADTDYKARVAALKAQMATQGYSENTVESVTPTLVTESDLVAPEKTPAESIAAIQVPEVLLQPTEDPTTVNEVEPVDAPTPLVEG